MRRRVKKTNSKDSAPAPAPHAPQAGGAFSRMDAQHIDPVLAQAANPEQYYAPIQPGSVQDKLRRHTGWFVEANDLMRHMQQREMILFFTFARALGYSNAHIYAAIAQLPQHSHLCLTWPNIGADVFAGRLKPADMLQQLSNHLRMIAGESPQDIKAEMAITARARAQQSRA